MSSYVNPQVAGIAQRDLESTVISVDAITAVDATALGLVAGDTIIAKGRDVPGDVSFGFPFIVEASGTVDGGTVFSIGGGLYARLQYVGAVDVKWFGAVGDGVTDDVSAINAALACGAGELNFSDGTYYVLAASLENDQPEKGLVVKQNMTITFSSGAKILHEANADSRHIFCSGAACDNVTFINPEIDGNNSSTNGIGLNDVEECHIIGGFLRGIIGGNVTPYQTSLGGGRAITFQSFKTNVSINGTAFENCSTCIDVSRIYNQTVCGGVAIADITAKDCEVIVGCLGGNGSYLPDSVDNLNLNSTVISGVTFHNCGKSNKTPLRTNLSLRRQNSTGNCFPFSSLARTGTSYASYDWLVLETGYNPALPEWDPTATYNVADEVKYTDDGTNSALFSCDQTSGLTIKNVRGYNEASYGTIGALYRGIGSNVSISDVDVTIAARKLIWHCPNPIINSFARPTGYAKNCHFFDIINKGTVEYLIESENPVTGSATADYMPIAWCAMEIYCDSNTVTTGFVGPNLASQSTNPYNVWLCLRNLSRGGTISGAAYQIKNVTTTDPSWASPDSQGYKNVYLNTVEVRTHSYGPAIKLTRTGTNPAVVTLGTSPSTLGDYLYLSNGLFIAGNAYNANLVRFNSLRLWVDGFNMLRSLNSDPGSATSGSPFGKKVSVPGSTSASGAPGQWAADTSYVYVYVGDGSTHSWVRAPAAVW